MGTMQRVKRGGLLLYSFMIFFCAASGQEVAPSNSIETGKGTLSSSEQPTIRIVNLKHRRYKSLRDNVTSSQERLALPTSNIEAASHPILHEHIHYEDVVPHNVKSPRNGFQIQKAPPDLQFGLAFTVPFVSLSTEKLLNTVSGKNYDSVSSLLKLNFSGLLLAAVVGLIAAAGIFLPSILNGHGFGGLGGLGPNFLENLFPPHFTDSQYNDFNGQGWGDKSSWKDTWNKDWNGRRNGRAEKAISAIGVGVLRLVEKFKSGVSSVEKCVVQRVCEEKKSGKDGRISGLIAGMPDNEVVKESGVYKVLRKVLDGDFSVCEKVEGLEYCKEFSGIEDSFLEIFDGWRKSGEQQGSGDGGGGKKNV